jgi:hypothetical protein
MMALRIATLVVSTVALGLSLYASTVTRRLRRGQTPLRMWWNALGWHGVLHFAYAPTVPYGASRYRWHHRLHLVPGLLLHWRCAVHDRTHEPARPYRARLHHESGSDGVWTLCRCGIGEDHDSDVTALARAAGRHEESSTSTASGIVPRARLQSRRRTGPASP